MSVATPGGENGRRSISACIITRDEASRLPACLASVAFCDEVLVVDSGSTDETVTLAAAAGAVVVHQPWLGFAAQRNVALDRARGDWVLEIDADERVSGPLQREIETFLGDPPEGFDLAGLPRRDIFLGRPLGRSAKYPNYCHRLLRRGAYRHDTLRTVHEGFIPEGSVHPFEGDLLHLLADSWGEALADAWRYARLESGQLESPRSLAGFLRGGLMRPALKFVYRISVDGGWRDGWRGAARIVIACGSDLVVWVRHVSARTGAQRGRSGVGPAGHYGSRKVHRGSLRVIGVAVGPRARAQATGWLAKARSAGADVALVTDGQIDEAGVRVRRIRRAGPLALMHALGAEEQLRSVAAVVAFGAPARGLLGCVPSSMRPAVPDLVAATDPTAVVARYYPAAVGPSAA